MWFHTNNFLQSISIWWISLIKYTTTYCEMIYYIPRCMSLESLKSSNVKSICICESKYCRYSRVSIFWILILWKTRSTYMCKNQSMVGSNSAKVNIQYILIEIPGKADSDFLNMHRNSERILLCRTSLIFLIPLQRIMR